MKNSKFYLAFLLAVLVISNVTAQKKIGVFVHGFNGSAEKWTVASEAPNRLISDGVIQDVVIFNYKSEELNTLSGRQAMFERFVRQMDEVIDNVDTPNSSKWIKREANEWVLISHSLGGIVSRVLYPNFKQQRFNVTGIVNIAGPVQGTAATNVDTDVIKNEIKRLKDDYKIATDHEWPLLAFYLDFTKILNAVFVQIPSLIEGGDANPSARALLNSIPEMMDVARDSALGYANYVLESKANELIGVQVDNENNVIEKGSVIRDINSFSESNHLLHPPNYISIIGAEKDMTPLRLVDYIFTSNERGDEYSILKEFNDFDIKYMKRNKDHWGNVAARWNACAWISKSCRRSRDTANRKKGYWNLARSNFHNIGTSWALLINSYKFQRVSHRFYIPPCNDGDDRLPGEFFRVVPFDPLECSSNPNGEYITEYTVVQHPDKNDGVVNINSVLWSEDDSFTNINNDPHNVYFTDEGDDGGYNHFELRHYFRPYDLPNGSGGYVFKKNQITPSMIYIRSWIENPEQ